jgi:hypothetical protein
VSATIHLKPIVNTVSVERDFATISPKLNVSAVVDGLVKGTIPLRRRYGELLVELVTDGQFRARSSDMNRSQTLVSAPFRNLLANSSLGNKISTLFSSGDFHTQMRILEALTSLGQDGWCS